MWPPRKIPGAVFSVRKMLRYIDSAAMGNCPLTKTLLQPRDFFCPQSSGLRSEEMGISHGLKSVHRTLFTRLRRVGLSISGREIMKKSRCESTGIFFMVTRTGIEPAVKTPKSVGIQRFFKIRVKWRVKFALFYPHLTQRSSGNPAPVLQCLSVPDAYIFCASSRHLPSRRFP